MKTGLKKMGVLTMLFGMGPCELFVICAIWAVFVLGVPSALGIYVWRKRRKPPPRKP